MSPREYTVFLIVLSLADFRNATWVGSAAQIAKTCHIRKQYAQQILKSLRAKHYIEFQESKGAHRRYPIYIPKYSVPGGTEERFQAEPRRAKKQPNGNRGPTKTYQTGTEDSAQVVSRHSIKCSEEVRTKNKREEYAQPLRASFLSAFSEQEWQEHLNKLDPKRKAN